MFSGSIERDQWHMKWVERAYEITMFMGSYGDHPFSTCAKFPEKLTIRTLRDGQGILVFGKTWRTYQMDNLEGTI